MMQKNETAIVTIEDIGVNGEGIGKVDGYTLFIKDAVIGDVVEAKVMKAKKNYGYARLMKIIQSVHLPENVADVRFRKCRMSSSFNLNIIKYVVIWRESVDFLQNF